MPTIIQLQAEPWWGREIVTDELDWLGDQLCARTGRPRDAFGTKGNTAHLNGGHRSQEWIVNSDWCTNTSYTVQSGLSETQARHIGAADFTPGAWGSSANRALVAAQTRRLWDAALAGRLAGLRQIQGTRDGRNPIGLNVLTGTLNYPDDSHLDHWHLTFDRKHMRDRSLMERILDIVIGDDMDTVITHNLGWRLQAVIAGATTIVVPPDSSIGAAGFSEPNRPQIQLNRLEALVNAIAAKVDLDPAELAAVEAAAAEGAKAGALAAAQPIAAAVAAELAGEFGLTVEQAQAAAERAVRRVLGKLDEVPPTP